MKISAFFNFPDNILKILKNGKKVKTQLDEVHSSIVGMSNRVDEAIQYNKKIWKGTKLILPHLQNMAFEHYEKISKIKKIYLSEMYPEIQNISLPMGVINEESGHENHVEMLYVVGLAKLINAKKIFEFGTYLGQTTYHLAGISEDTHVYTLDIKNEDPKIQESKGRYFRNTEREQNITTFTCDSKCFDFSSYKGKMDFIFVDGGHTYKDVKNDTLKAFEMLAPGGMILWHDYAPKTPDIPMFFSEFTQTTPLFRINNTSLLFHIDGVDPLKFETKEKEIYIRSLKPV